MLDEQGYITSYFKELNGLVVQAERYTYSNYQSVKTETANKSKLNATAFSSSFDFGITDYTETVNNEFYIPKTKTNYKYLSSTHNLTETTNYSYDTNNNCIKTETELVLNANGQTESYTYVTKNYYNANNKIIKTESYVQGEEKQYGKNIVATQYDNKGKVIKQISYNTLDTTNKLYKEQEYNGQGELEKEYDQTGENSTKYNYLKSKLNDITLPNGSKVAYGYESDRLTAISQSNSMGEGNSNQSHYNYGKVTKVESNDFSVDYTYEKKGRVSAVSFNGQQVFNVTYSDYPTAENDIVKTVYAPRGTDNKADYFENEYDYKGNLVKTKYANESLTSIPTMTTQMEYYYDEHGKLINANDQVAGVTHIYEYDDQDRVTNYTFGLNKKTNTYSNTGELVESRLSYKTDSSSSWDSAGSLTYSYEYSNDSKKRLLQTDVLEITEQYSYDSLERDKKVTQTVNGNVISKDYGYYKNGDHATNLINSVTYKTNGKVTDKELYTYDSMGNIISVSKNGSLLKEYKYDSLGRIIYENNIDTGKEISYTYDRQGNILSKTENGTKTDYTYDENGFKLLSAGTQNYTYDGLGNPLNLDSSYYQASWTKANQLSTLYATSHNLGFSYDGNGILKSINVAGGSTSYEYVYENGRIIRQKRNGNVEFDFLYGKEGVIGFSYNDNIYLYQKNIFGDIVKILDSTGQTVAEYSYTAFGECTIVTDTNSIGNKNPLRYRGYFQERNSGLYYLKSRFYNPITGRFISPDDTKYLQPDVINGLNLYSYCGNNPVMNVDPNGNFFISALLIGAAVGAGIAFASTVYQDYKDDGEIFNGSVGWRQYLGNSLGGAISGAGVGLSGALGLSSGVAFLSSSSITIGGISLTTSTAMALSVGVSFASGGVGYLLRVGISDNENFSMKDFNVETILNAVNGAYSFVGGFLGGALGLKQLKVNSLKNKVKYHGLLVVTGVYPSKTIISIIKNCFKKGC